MRYPDRPTSLLDLEEEVLRLWREEDLFRETLRAAAGGEPFVFYEGPPTANGRPGLHHIISRTIKDIVCRHRAMQGRRVTRIAGWDTHGLPVEIEAEQKLGISGKPEIEEFGIARFNEVCRDSVFTYKEEWERFSERIGYWLDYARPYVTFHTAYIESVWWILKELAGRGLLYRGHKSVPYCPRCGTALSSHEVAQGYEEVEDPSLYFLCDVIDASGAPDPERRAFLVWTTTPWTVPSNVALAVRGDLEYAEVEWEGRRLIAAAGSECDASVALRGRRSEPLAFRIFYRLYRVFFGLLTGRQIRFGNFCALGRRALLRLTAMQETRLHPAAALIKSRLGRQEISCDRGTRYDGRSRMNFYDLALHGIRAVAVFDDAVLTRMGVVCIGAAVSGVLVFLAGLGLKLSGQTSPGWLTFVTGFLVMVFLQTAIFSLVALIMNALGYRSPADLDAAAASLILETETTGADDSADA